MGWYYRSPLLFPYALKVNMKAAVSDRDGIIYKICKDKSTVKKELEYIRYFRWCLRHPKAPIDELRILEENYDFKTRVEIINAPSGTVYAIRLRAAPARLPAILALNPFLVKYESEFYPDS